jgi:hypothetical protein
MDNKNTNTNINTNITNPKFQPKPDVMNRTYVSQFNIDYSHNSNLFSIFSTSDFNAINVILNSNEILNFRTEKGETLVHAIIRNPDPLITESNRKHIIEILVHKNVSLNAMNEYNQAAIHLAAQHGYFDIFNYLITKQVDYNIVDNYGNAPIHYLIDKFVDECKNNELYNDANKDVKTLGKKQEKHDEKIVEHELLSATIDMIKEEQKNDGYIKYIFDSLNAMIDKYKLSKNDEIIDIIESKKKEINDLYLKYSNENIDYKIKEILNSAVIEIFKLYNDFIVNITELQVENLSFDQIESTVNSKIQSINNELNNKIDKIMDDVKVCKKLIDLLINNYFTTYLRAIYVFFYMNNILSNDGIYSNFEFNTHINQAVEKQSIINDDYEYLIDLSKYFDNVKIDRKINNYDNEQEAFQLINEFDLSNQHQKFYRSIDKTKTLVDLTFDYVKYNSKELDYIYKLKEILTSRKDEKYYDENFENADDEAGNADDENDGNEENADDENVGDDENAVEAGDNENVGDGDAGNQENADNEAVNADAGEYYANLVELIKRDQSTLIKSIKSCFISKFC